MLDAAYIELALNRTTSQQLVQKYSKKLEKLLPEKSVVENKFSKYWAVIQIDIDRIQVSLESKTNRENDNETERVPLLVFKKKLKY